MRDPKTFDQILAAKFSFQGHRRQLPPSSTPIDSANASRASGIHTRKHRIPDERAMRRGRTQRQRQEKKQLRQGLRQEPRAATARGRPCTDQAWTGLREWCKSRGMPKTKLTLAYFPDTFRGMMATRDIGAGEDLIQVPERLLVTASRVRRHTMARAAAAVAPTGHGPRWSLTEHQALAYWLLEEAERQAASEWSSYIESLPRDFCSVPLFALAGNVPSDTISSESESAQWIAAHLPHSMRQKVARQQTRLLADWQKTRAFLAEAGLPQPPPEAWRRYVWAWLAVNTRCIHLGLHADALAGGACQDTIALAPVLDFLNHSEHADVETRFDPRARQFVIRTNRGFRRGEEVFISYGPHDNRFMLAEYGFVLERNPFQTLELDHAVALWIAAAKARLQTPRPARATTMSVGDIDTLVAVLERQGLWGDYTISLDDLEPSYRLQAALRLLLFAEQEGVTAKQAVARWERWRCGGPGTYAGDAADTAQPPAVRRWVEAVCATLAEQARRALAEIDTVSAGGGADIDAFLIHCLRTVWREISAIAICSSQN
ncbi:hypothetical protein GGI07_005058 [Coemansia sp. Benny D115]|nr:hypothetical protein GGI07_005058 [Coemansia sp. Benny D115]